MDVMIRWVASRCPDCDERMVWGADNEQFCSWCRAYGKPEEEDES